MHLNAGETFVAIVGIISTFGTLALAVFIFGMRGIFGKGKRALESEMKELQALIGSQSAVIQQLKGRVENLETIVTSNEYQAAERISRALGSTPAMSYNPPQEQAPRRTLEEIR